MSSQKWFNYSYDFESIYNWMIYQIAKKECDPTVTSSWYKYARQTKKWERMHFNSAPGFCELARQVGMRINRQYGFDVIRLNFPGIYQNCIEKGMDWDSGLSPVN